jgi:hypothetical protein
LIFRLEADQVILHDTVLWKCIIGLVFLIALIPQYIYGTIAPLVGSARIAMASSLSVELVAVGGYVPLLLMPIKLNQSLLPTTQLSYN